ncbi:uncharacterized protein LOC135167695 [Diachasmimorpha longicaudata]|uniref:uncharacterized protein LOC135167695 n=1 Tax=Diachasmimorpha longicaudata TaxID=58733 RepID=UPI0030B8EE35
MVPSRVCCRPPCVEALPSQRGKCFGHRTVHSGVAVEDEGLTEQEGKPTPGSSRSSTDPQNRGTGRATRHQSTAVEHVPLNCSNEKGLSAHSSTASGHTSAPRGVCHL